LSGHSTAAAATGGGGPGAWQWRFGQALVAAAANGGVCLGGGFGQALATTGGRKAADKGVAAAATGDKKAAGKGVAATATGDRKAAGKGVAVVAAVTAACEGMVLPTSISMPLQN